MRRKSPERRYASIITKRRTSAAPTSSSGRPPPCMYSSAPAATSSPADTSASGGRSVIQGLDLFIVSSLPRGRFARAQEQLVLEQLAETETRPDLRTLHESPIEIAVAANH